MSGAPYYFWVEGQVQASHVASPDTGVSWGQWTSLPPDGDAIQDCLLSLLLVEVMDAVVGVSCYSGVSIGDAL